MVPRWLGISYNNLRDLKNGHMRRQIRYKLWKDFEQKSDYDVRQAQVNKKPKDPREYYPHIPERLWDTVKKSLDKTLEHISKI